MKYHPNRLLGGCRDGQRQYTEMAHSDVYIEQRNNLLSGDIGVP